MLARHRLFRMLLLFASAVPVRAHAQKPEPAPVLVELFTSEGCSSCPPADQLLGEVNGTLSAAGQRIIALSEHVSYWNRLGWTDPFSAELYTERQNDYSARFHTEGPYTPQMVVNGREQFVGSDRGSLSRALAGQSSRRQIQLHITEASLAGKQLSFRYSAAGLRAGETLQLMAAVVDDSDRSNVERGENSGRSLQHIFVVRSLKTAGKLRGDGQGTVTLSVAGGMPPSQPRHLVVFAQQPGLGEVLGVDATAL